MLFRCFDYHLLWYASIGNLRRNCSRRHVCIKLVCSFAVVANWKFLAAVPCSECYFSQAIKRTASGRPVQTDGPRQLVSSFLQWLCACVCTRASLCAPLSRGAVNEWRELAVQSHRTGSTNQRNCDIKFPERYLPARIQFSTKVRSAWMIFPDFSWNAFLL